MAYTPVMSHPYTRGEKGKAISGSYRRTRDPLIRLLDETNPELVAANKLTLIGRILNINTQRPKVLIGFMPQVWRMENMISGKDLCPEKYQSEEDLQSVLKDAPFHFKCWMFVLQRWEPIISDTFPSKIPFWIRIHGLPLHCCTDNNLRAIGKVLGSYLDHDVKE